jgi:hypothetical protein
MLENTEVPIKNKDKQRSTKHTYKTKDRVTRTPLKTGMDSGALLKILTKYLSTEHIVKQC